MSEDAIAKFFYQRKFENSYPVVSLISASGMKTAGWDLDEMWSFKFIVPYFTFEEAWKLYNV